MPGILSNYLSSQRTKRIIPYLAGDILDIGCGKAKNLEVLKKEGISFSSYTGIEFDSVIVNELTVLYPDSQFYQRDLDKDEINIEVKFDTIILLAVIEHIFNLKFLFSQLSEMLKDSGRIVLTTPTPFGNDIVHKLGASIGLFDVEGGQDDHIVIFNRKRLDILAREVRLNMTYYKRFQFGCNQVAIFEKELNTE